MNKKLTGKNVRQLRTTVVDAIEKTNEEVWFFPQLQFNANNY
jgi:hypothetical protein